MAEDTRKDTVLILGSGGREHALAMKIAESPLVKKVLVAPGNDGMPSSAKEGSAAIEILPLALTPPFSELLAVVKTSGVSLVVVGPEDLLAADVVGVLVSNGVLVFGPSLQAARLEYSKAFAKEIMHSAGVSTASSQQFDASSIEQMRSFIHSRLNSGFPLPSGGFPLVVKADGLCAGKGVVIAANAQQAIEAAEAMLGGRYGEAGNKVLLEDFALGQELSVLGVCRGEEVALLPASQDNKRLLNNDKGPNTGGMGVVSPLPFVTKKLLKRIEQEVFLPTLRQLTQRGIYFSGVLYAGLMLNTATGDNGRIDVLEFNTRFGDPECQCVLARIKSDFYPLLKQASLGSNADGAMPLAQLASGLVIDDRPAVTVVLASKGYPTALEKGMVITSGAASTADSENSEIKILTHYAGVKKNNGQLCTSGGRVLAVTALASTLAKAQEAAYGQCSRISFAGKQWRSDIGKKFL